MSLHPAKRVEQSTACTANMLVTSMDILTTLAALCLLAVHADLVPGATPRPGTFANHFVCTSVDLYASLSKCRDHPLINSALLPDSEQEL